MSVYSEEPGDTPDAREAWYAERQKEWTSRPNGKGMSRWAVVVGGIAALVSVIAIGGVLHLPGSSASTAASGSGRSGSSLFYHPVNQLAVPRWPDGSIHLDAKVGERPVKFIVDPGIATVVLSPEDARAAGLSGGNLDYSGRMKTSSGEVRIAPVSIQQLIMGSLTLFDVQAAVAEDPIPNSILGASFLKRFPGYELEAERLVLHW